MKVTQVSLVPSEVAQALGRPGLTPELLAATGARYSRNNEGLESILARIDPTNLDRSVDGIFRMIDYGHQSIADMAPVAMFMDEISLWLAYYVWSICPTAGGQESSTRYLRLSEKSLLLADQTGMPESVAAEWLKDCQKAFVLYEQVLRAWEAIAHAEPERMRIPEEWLADPDEKTQRKVERLRRNYAFDRARYYLPVGARTNVMLVMSARAWVTLIQHLLSHPIREAQLLGEEVRRELELVTPRLIRHAVRKESLAKGIAEEWVQWAQASQTFCPDDEAGDQVSLQVNLPADVDGLSIAKALQYHENRYAWLGQALRRSTVRVRWEAMALAEIRDLNRHRTGTKWCPMVPAGFYAALEQLEPEERLEGDNIRSIREAVIFGRQMTAKARQFIARGEVFGIYFSLLGTQFPFEHTTTADKFIYEAELRTGLGAHFRYAKHLRDALQCWYEQFPETRGLVIEGQAEPE